MQDRSTAPQELVTHPVFPNKGKKPPHFRPRTHKLRRHRIAITAISLIALAVGGIGLLIGTSQTGFAGLFTKSGRSSSTGAPTASIVGHVYFESSGQISGYSSTGINDEALIDLFNISPPSSGESYYAWILSGSVEGKPTLLGQLPVDNGHASLFYPGNPEHSNLLLTADRFVVTEESAQVTPTVPSPDRDDWRYAFAYSQVPNSQERPAYNLLDHLHHLLSADPDLDQVGLYGGLNIWLFRDTQKLLEWAGSASRSWGKDPGLIHRQVTRILEYLDGSTFAWKDLPKGTPLLVDPQVARVALLETDVQNQEPPGLLYHIGQHLQGIVDAPGASHTQQEIAAHIDQMLNQVGAWMLQMRDEAKTLAQDSPQQLAKVSALTLLNTLSTQALYAFSGRMLPSTNTWQGGVMQIYEEIPTLATMDIVPVHCNSNNTANQPKTLCL